MSLKTIQVCDRCGYQDCPYDSIYAAVDSLDNHKGVIDGLDTEAVDLCPICMRTIMAEMVEKMTREQAADWVRRAKTKQTPIRL